MTDICIEVTVPSVGLETAPVTVEVQNAETTVAVASTDPVVVVEQTEIVLAVTESPIDIEFSVSGGTGPPGPAQIFNLGAAPVPVSGYTLLWFKTPVPPTGDPNDRDVSLIEFP